MPAESIPLPPPSPPSVLGPLVSVVIPCCGMREYTKLLIPSLLRHTRPPFELLFLDVGSLDGTAEYLDGLAAGLPNVRIEVARAATDLDISATVKDLFSRIRGEFVVLLNNDTVVTNGWLNQLIGLATMSPTIGMVGPMSNYAAPPQLVESIPYRIARKRTPGSGMGKAIPTGLRSSPEDLLDVSAVESFARDFRETNKGKWLATDRLGGFCMLLKREVLRQITNQGHLEKWTDLSLFDTDIVSSKAREAGFTLAVCRDLFVHHFGARTFAHGAAVEPGSGAVVPRS